MKKKLNKIVVAVALFMNVYYVGAQVTPFSIKGRVVDKSNDEVVGANVVLCKPNGKGMIGFTLSESDGTYAISVNTEADTLILMVSGFNISSQRRIVTRLTDTANFIVSNQEQKIREAKVTANPIKRVSDTLTYYVSQFKEETDRTIGDVLKKMPGIEVSASGGIKYNGRSINKFYIEGLDMLGGKYGIAAGNIQADDIALVEVYEGHQPIRVLEGWVRSDEAALNLRLKQGAKGAWNGVVCAGGGYSPAQWTACITPMMFSRKFQTILTYKTNNIGDDVGQELKSQFGSFGYISPLITCISPQDPPLDEKTWLRNNIHAASANGIQKLGDDSDVTAKIHLIHDIRQSSGLVRTEYHVPGLDSFSVEESSQLKDVSQELELNLQYRQNSRKNYVLDEISVKAERIKDFGSVSNDGRTVDQEAILPFFCTTNSLQYVKPFGDIQVTTRSIISLSHRNSTLDVTPNTYGEILGQKDTMRQSIISNRIYSANSALTSYRIGRMILGLSVQYDLEMDSFKSRLAPADSMRNDITWKRFDASVGPGVSYEAGRFSVDAQLPLRYIVINGDEYPQVDPSVNVRLKANRSLTFKASMDRSHSLSGLYDSFDGYVMTNYRNITSQGGSLNKVIGTTALLETTYANALFSFFANGRILHTSRSSDLTYGIVYDGDFTRTKQYDIKNENGVTAVSINASKRFQGLSTTVKVGFDASASHNQFMRQNLLMPVSGKTISTSWGLDTRIGLWAILSYSGVSSANVTRFDKSASTTIKAVNQSIIASFIIGKYVTVNTSLCSYHNNKNEVTQRHLGFVNSGVSYRTERIEYTLEAYNLLNTKTYSSTVFSTNTVYSTVYNLKPFSIVLSVRLSLK